MRLCHAKLPFSSKFIESWEIMPFLVFMYAFVWYSRLFWMWLLSFHKTNILHFVGQIFRTLDILRNFQFKAALLSAYFKKMTILNFLLWILILCRFFLLLSLNLRTTLQFFSSAVSHNASNCKTHSFVYFSFGCFMMDNSQCVWKSNIITLNSN